MARRDTDNTISAEDRKLSFAFEINVKETNSCLIFLLQKYFEKSRESLLEPIPAKKRTKELISQLKQFTSFNFKSSDLLKRLHFLQKEKVRIEKERQVDVNVHLVMNGGSELIKSGKYGPEIDDFSMALPANFPSNAGNSRYALKAPIDLYNALLSKKRVESLPTTLEDFYIPTYYERWISFYHRMIKIEERRYRKKMVNVFKEFNKLKFFERNTYLSRRRKTYLTLPGLSAHYPNPNYPVSAIVPAGIDYQPKASGKNADKLYGNDVIQTVIVNPVGRKPPLIQMLTIQNSLYARKAAEYIEEIDNQNWEEKQEEFERRQQEEREKAKERERNVKAQTNEINTTASDAASTTTG
jgi:hypothetical protein